MNVAIITDRVSERSRAGRNKSLKPVPGNLFAYLEMCILHSLIQYKLGAAYEDERRASGCGTAIFGFNCVRIIIPGSGITKQLILRLDLSLKTKFSLTVK